MCRLFIIESKKRGSHAVYLRKTIHHTKIFRIYPTDYNNQFANKVVSRQNIKQLIVTAILFCIEDLKPWETVSFTLTSKDFPSVCIEPSQFSDPSRLPESFYVKINEAIDPIKISFLMLCGFDVSINTRIVRNTNISL